MRRTALAALALVAVLATSPAGAQDAADARPARPPGTKVIKDPAEYSAYTQALNEEDPGRHAAAMEAFIAAYPRSIAKEEALEQAMAAYQRAGDEAKVADAAQRILDMDAKNLRALAVLTALERAQVTTGGAATLAAMGDHADKGLAELPKWSRPTGMADEAYKSLRDTMTVVFVGARGMALLQAKDFEQARKAYLKALAIDPANLEDAYQIGVAEMQIRPLRVGGFWWLARAYDLAGAQNNPPVRQAIGAYARAKYVAYHGSDAGWDAVVASARDKPKPPDDFEVRAASPK